MRRVAAIVFTAAVLVALAACGGGGGGDGDDNDDARSADRTEEATDSGNATDSDDDDGGDDQEFADDAVITEDDVTSEFSDSEVDDAEFHETAPSGEPDLPDDEACDDFRASSDLVDESSEARAQFEDEDGRGIDESVGIFEDQGDAEDALDGTRDAEDCLAIGVAEQFDLDPSEVQVTEGDLEGGDESVSYSIDFETETDDGTPFGVRVDVIFLRSGSGVAELSFTGFSFHTFNPRNQRNLLDVAVERMEDALDQ